MEIEKDVLSSNLKFWEKESNNLKKECLFFEAFYGEQAMLYGIIKTAITIAKVKDLRPICIAGLRGKKEKFAFIKSMCNTVVGGKFDFSISTLLSLFGIFKYFFSIREKDNLIKLKIGKYEIGKYIYDAILKTLNLAEISEITFPVRKLIFLELSYFYFFKRLLNKYNVKTIVLGDSVYRTGLLLELAKHNGIECITPISLNNFSMRKYDKYEDFNVHYRKPDIKILDKLDVKEIEIHLEKYFSKRFDASLEQHDVLKAFSNEKKIYSKSEIISQYGLNEKLPIVVVMSHIFCDAPHAYPGLPYDDYKEWLIKTIEKLKNNKLINFLVKEHPSAELYNEKGTINAILRGLDCEQFLLKDDVHTLTILKEFDIVVTGGGTIGQEFAYMGKPVVLAAKAPYSGFGFTTDFNSRVEYEDFLSSGIEKLGLLNEEQRTMVKKVIYHDFVLFDNYDDNLELGGERFYLGRNFDYNSFYANILKYNQKPLVEQLVYKKIEKFINSKNRYMIKEK